MWWRLVLAALGIAYETIRCIACLLAVTKRKSDPLPDGWCKVERGWLCPNCK